MCSGTKTQRLTRNDGDKPMWRRCSGMYLIVAKKVVTVKVNGKYHQERQCGLASHQTSSIYQFVELLNSCTGNSDKGGWGR